MVRIGLALGCSLCLSITGCGDDAAPTSTIDAGPPEADAGGPSVALEPALPVLGPCPAGWAEAGEAPATCEPWPSSGREACGEGTAHLPGHPGCVPVGAACPAGTYPEDLPADAPVVYVRPGGTGTGTRDDPYGSLSSAIRSTGAGATIALAKGTYDAPHRLASGVTVVGACAAETILVNTVVPSAPVVTVEGDGATLRNVRVGPSASGGIWATSGGSFALDGVIVTGATRFGILLVGAQLTARAIVVEGTVPDATLGAGRGMLIQGGGSAEVREAAFLRNAEMALQVFDGARVLVEDAIIAGTGEGIAGAPGDMLADSVGLFAFGGADVTLRRVVLEGNYDQGIGLVDETTTFLAEDAILRDHVPPSEGGRGGSALVARGARVTLRRTVVSRTHDLAVAGEDGAHVILEDVVIRETQPDLAGNIEGRAFELHGASTGEVRRGYFADNLDIAVFLEGGAATLEDVTIVGTRPAADTGLFGRGLEVQDGADVTVRRLRASDNRDIGVFVGGTGARLDAEDLTVERTSADGSRASGTGIVVQSGATLLARRALLEDNHNVGVLAYFPDTRVELRESQILRTLPRECAIDTCADHPSGSGVATVDSATALLEDFVISGSSLCGALLSSDGAIDLRRGEVKENLIGACVQTDGFDLGRLSEDVRYIDNETNLDATVLPVPDPATPG